MLESVNTQIVRCSLSTRHIHLHKMYLRRIYLCQTFTKKAKAWRISLLPYVALSAILELGHKESYVSKNCLRYDKTINLYIQPKLICTSSKNTFLTPYFTHKHNSQGGVARVHSGLNFHSARRTVHYRKNALPLASKK